MTEAEFESAVLRIKSGDRDGLKEIYLAYVKFIYSVVLNIVGTKENAEDVTSDVFIKLWDALDRYKPGSGHKGYLATIARNTAIDFMRKAGREIPMPTELDDANEDSCNNQTQGGSGSSNTIFDTGGSYDPIVNPGTEDTVVGEYTVKEALASLSPPERDVVSRKILGDMSFKEISEELKIPMGTITWRYQNAMNKLRRLGYE